MKKKRPYNGMVKKKFRKHDWVSIPHKKMKPKKYGPGVQVFECVEGGLKWG